MGGVLSEMIDHQEDFVPYHNRSTLKQIEDYRSNNPLVTSFLLMPTVIVVNTDLQGDMTIHGYKDLLQSSLKGVSFILILILRRRDTNICVRCIICVTK